MSIDKEQIFQFIDAHRIEMIECWRDMVNQDTYSAYKEGVDKLQNKLKDQFEDDGAKVRIVEFANAGNMLIAEFGGGPQPAVVFGGHVDTVFEVGSAQERPFTISEGRAYGPGVLDMKGGVVAMLYAVKALRAAGFSERPIKVLLAGDEEPGHGSSNAPQVFIREATGCAAAFNCETGFADDGIVVGRKGVGYFNLEVRGVAAHCGNEPEKGRSAIREVAHKVIEIEKLADLPKGITANIGVIEGGTVSNAIPAFAKIQIDARCNDDLEIPILTKKLEDIAAITYVEGTSTTFSGGFRFQPMKTTEGVKQLFELVKTVSSENGFGIPYAKFSGGGADSAYTVMAGVPTVCAMGVKGGRNHSTEEYAIVETLFERAKLLALCVLNLDRLKIIDN
jgi:glutamate carboxypeptidase